MFFSWFNLMECFVSNCSDISLQLERIIFFQIKFRSVKIIKWWDEIFIYLFVSINFFFLISNLKVTFREQTAWVIEKMFFSEIMVVATKFFYNGREGTKYGKIFFHRGAKISRIFSAYEEHFNRGGANQNCSFSEIWYPRENKNENEHFCFEKRRGSIKLPPGY